MEREVFIFECTTWRALGYVFETLTAVRQINQAIYQIDFVSFLGLVKSLVSKQEFAVQWELEKEDLS